VLSAAGDIVFIINADGMITDGVFASGDLPSDFFIGWPGKALIDTVTLESRPKVTEMLQDVVTGQPPRWRQLNHPLKAGEDLPVRYKLIRAGRDGHAVAVGRDMRMVASMQQRLVSAELSIEQDYARLRHVETRYRLLMQVATEALIVVDGRSGRVVEANPAAANLLNKQLRRLVGSAFTDAFSGADLDKVSAMLASLRSVGRVDDVALSLGGEQQAVTSATVFRENNAVLYMFRLFPLAVGARGVVVPRQQSQALAAIQAMPDAFVLTDMDRRIIATNAAFLEIIQLGTEEQARGEPLDRWLGRVGVDTGLLYSSVIEHKIIRQFSTVLRGQFGTVEDVEVSGVALKDSEPPVTDDPGKRSLLRSVDEMTKLVGKVPLKDLVRETTDIIERLCIEAALQLNDNNRASSADMLGLSRQSLYVKLHRHGIEEKGGPEKD
jgi:transcriptional regulator PpsR